MTPHHLPWIRVGFKKTSFRMEESPGWARFVFEEGGGG